MRAELSAPSGYKPTMLLPDQLAWYNGCCFLTVPVMDTHRLMKNINHDILKSQRYWK
jgi:hypothetical protein